ncbi:hormonally up-regulated neu tumor-associated kinase homolog A [Alosa sapidissima]|uniref:hormonally up-regulated neu tumor-associated kinase homolog A n=1 Tax=Alosa sapidissima TaxID=34773 RepID=UPI001C09C8DD|nr:hormonally up-regulated neu tumor-associated kinase homolog A [Alosa sapidissima]
MPAAVKAALEEVGTQGELERGKPSWEAPERDRDKEMVPPCLGKVSRELVKNFPHTKRVGSYLVGRMINKGSFAKVMEGLHISTGEKVAIKVIDKKRARQDAYVQKNMKREPRIHQMILHPHVVLLLETLETENCYYMAMELCAGGDLMERICQHRRLEEREARKYTRQILSAVEHLHRHGIVHRDLKIENFLLDEHNHIKIVDFGLSNTLKVESVAAELLSTQCGSPAYAAPELLAHKKYGPKVDVWSVGVSTFAMLTGTLPFTVEPFNIKQLHQKMVNGEINAIPSDISKAAVQFVLCLLEPDPEKRPSIKTAMEEKWLNEGYAKRPLHTVTYKNRLRPEELNTSILNYMTESLGYGLSDVIHTVINNRPSAIMAAYHLLLKKLLREQRGAKAMKKAETSEWGFPSKNLWREKTNVTPKNHQQERNGTHITLDPPHTDTANGRSARQSSKVPRSQSQERDSLSGRKRAEEVAREKQLSTEQRAASPSRPSVDGIGDEEIAITIETRELLLPEVSPPKCSCREGSGSNLCDSSPCDMPIATDGVTKEPSPLSIKQSRPDVLLPSHSDGSPGDEPLPAQHQHHHHGDEKLEKLQTFYSDKAFMMSPRMHLESRAGQRFKDLLLAIEEKAAPPTRLFSAMETTNSSSAGGGGGPQASPLPRLRHAAGPLKDAVVPRKVTWVGLARGGGVAPGPGSSPFLVNGSKPPAYASQRQQALVIKSLRHAKDKRSSEGRGGGGGGGGGRMITTGDGTKRNSVQLRGSGQRRVGELNLPMLPAAFHSKASKKSELLRMDFS